MKNIEITPNQALGIAITAFHYIREYGYEWDEDMVNFMQDHAEEIDNILRKTYGDKPIPNEEATAWIKELILKGIEACKN